MTAQTTFDILASQKTKSQMIAELRANTDPGTLIEDLEELDFAAIFELYSVLEAAE